MVVALAGIAPVEHERAAVGAITQVDPSKPGVGGEEDVGLVPPDEAAARAIEPLDVDAPAVKVQGEQLVPIGRRPLVGEVDHHAAMGVATAAVVVETAGYQELLVWLRVVPVIVVGVLVDDFVRPRVGFDRMRSGQVRAPGSRARDAH